jgi:hypothetical protein
MLRRMQIRWLLPLVAGALLAGCSREPNAAAPTSPTATTTAGGPVLLGAPPVRVATPQGATYTAKLMRADRDGDIALGNVAIRFPKGSLPFTTMVSLSTLGDGLVGFRVEPANLTLLTPALIKIEQLDRTNEKALPGLRVHLQQRSGARPLETRRDGNKIEADALTLGEFRIGSDDGDAATGIQWLYYLDGPGYSTVMIEADKGGKVVCGRYQVTLPAGALASDTYITVRDPGNWFVSCELEPHGIQFLVPVELQIDLHGLYYSPFTDWSIFWLAGDDGQWQNQGGSFADEKVKASLWHFSTYAPARGRAGW